ncbi:MAG: VWA domain-containing protein [Candidatus Hydrogenedentes bacterium]|nr:VWA domain-containing protein [Candidatus Hydrogenedentota bacterium]
MKQGLLGLVAAWALTCAALPMNAPRAEGYAEHVVIILDGSGSMSDPIDDNGNKMDAAKSALKEVLKQIEPGTEVGLLVFSSHSPAGPWHYPLGKLEIDRLIGAIDRVQAGGGTPLGEFIKRGADTLIETRKQQFGYGAYRLLIVTDGEATDMDVMLRYAKEVTSRGISMDVIGVKMDRQPALSKLARSYREANNPESLARAIEDVFAELSPDQPGDTAVEDFELLQALPAGAAKAMLDGLTKTSDAPIGAMAPLPEIPTPDAVPRHASNPTPSQNAGSDNGMFSMPGAGILLVIFIVVMGVVSGNAKKRKRRR